MKIHEVPGVLVMEWNDQGKVVVDTWLKYTIKTAEFREAILKKGVGYAKARGARAWVVDSSKATGTYAQEVQDLIAKEVFKAFAAIGVKYFITIKSGSAITNLAFNRVTSQLGPSGIQMVDVPDLKTALTWLREHP